MVIAKRDIHNIVRKTVISNLAKRSTYSDINQGFCGSFNTIDEAVEAAKTAQQILIGQSLDKRAKLISAIRDAAMENVEKLSKMAKEETGFGKIEHKILKNKLAIEKTPGIEDLRSHTYTGDNGLTLVESAPFGVIGAITPSTNPTATIINNSISMIAAGNAVVFNPHPSAKNCSLETIRIINEAIYAEGGPECILTSVYDPSLESSKELMNHRDVKILVVTGGEAVVKIAMASGKKVIAAGPGNPPVIVDNTADIKKAASDIVKGASFDNNILCISEKEVFAFQEIEDLLVNEMTKNNCYQANSDELKKIMEIVFEKRSSNNYHPSKRFIGKDAAFILREAGINVSRDYALIIACVCFEHPLVKNEMLMPILPIVSVNGLDDALGKAVEAENGYGHTAIMHSKDVDSLTKAARALNTTIFVKNAPSYAGLGFEGEGYTSLTIATPTGEGITSAKTFTKQRRCTLSGSFRII